MRNWKSTRLVSALVATAPLSLAMLLAACGDDNGSSPVVIPTPAPSPSPSPSPSATPAATYSVASCLNQVIPGTGGATPASLVIPDTLKINTSTATSFPNGRGLADPVVDITLAVLFLDVNAPGQSAATFAGLPLNPPANDRPFLTTFPYLAAPQGTPPLASGTGSGFNFRSDPPSSFVRVDREGMPAVSAALIGAAQKNNFNDDDPADDASGPYVPEMTQQLTLLTNGLADDLIALGLKPCATPK
jgi:hypothetical protein